MLEWVAMPSSGDLPDPGMEPASPALQAGSLPSELPGKPSIMYSDHQERKANARTFRQGRVHPGKCTRMAFCQVILDPHKLKFYMGTCQMNDERDFLKLPILYNQCAKT